MSILFKAQTLLCLLALAACGEDPAGNADDLVPALLSVAERGDLPALDALLAESGSPDVRDACRWTPLMKAALNGHVEAVRHLLAAGAAPDAEDKGGYTAMMLAASNDHSEVVALLLEKGAMIDHQEATGGWTALIWAAKQGHAQTVHTLLVRGADSTLRDFSGHSAAGWAGEGEHTDVLALLAQDAEAPSADSEDTTHGL
ncbi:MAG: ankyrin repeat domain-containing protein [Pseudomonadota bacterium]|nr:ankyrin repeat domain-containing protein [Pseudomonadota bacterium]